MFDMNDQSGSGTFTPQASASTKICCFRIPDLKFEKFKLHVRLILRDILHGLGYTLFLHHLIQSYLKLFYHF